MAKRSLEFHSPKGKSKASKTENNPISPSGITSIEEHATVAGVIASLSPIKPSRYFDGELTDGNDVIRVVGFDKSKQQELQNYSDYEIPVTLRNCMVQRNKFKNCLEIVIKNHTKIEASQMQFNVPNLKTVGSTMINLSQLHQYAEHDRVTVRVSVLKVNEPQTLNGGKIKQDVTVCDATGKASLTLWGSDVGFLKPKKSYQLNRLEVRSYQGKYHLAFPSTISVDDISDIEDLDLITSDDDSDNGDDSLQSVTVSGIRLESTYSCIACNRTVEPMDDNIAQCTSCKTTQILSSLKQSAKLTINSEGKRFTLRANDSALREIAEVTSSKQVSAQDVLFAPQFDIKFNKFNIITHISRK